MFYIVWEGLGVIRTGSISQGVFAIAADSAT